MQIFPIYKIPFAVLGASVITVKVATIKFVNGIRGNFGWITWDDKRLKQSCGFYPSRGVYIPKQTHAHASVYIMCEGCGSDFSFSAQT